MPDAIPITEDVFSIFFDNTPDLLCITDREGHFLKVNQSWQKVLGFAPEEIIGRSYTEFTYPDDLDQDLAIINRVNQPDSDGEIIHYINRYRCKTGGFRYLEWGSRGIGDLFNCIARDITERIEYEKRIEFLSFHDQLTHLYNRHFIEEELLRLDTARNLPLSLIIGDLNRLKLVNDAFGHEQGDELIRQAARALRSSCRPDDLIARIGGDEFLVVLPRTSIITARQIIDRISIQASGVEVSGIPLGLSLGCAEKTMPDQLISDIYREAETRMYTMKSQLKGRSRSSIIKRLADLLNQKSSFEENHAKRVSALCRKLAEALDLHETDVNWITLSGLLHDIGKISVEQGILLKPGKLSADEYIKIQQHAKIGSQVLESAQEAVEVSEAILSHHERLDGTGYPYGLHAREIPLAARIIAIADSYDSMTQKTVYHEAMT